MTFYIGPDFRMSRIPGQVPKMDAVLDSMFQFPRVHIQEIEVQSQRPMNRVEQVVSELGLNPARERLLCSVVSRELGGATNEVVFRQGLMNSLMEQRVEPEIRRAIMVRALDLYRGQVGRSGNVMPAHEESLGGRRRKERFTVRVEDDLDADEPAGATKSLKTGGANPAEAVVKDKDITAEIKSMLDEAGDIGISISELTRFIQAHGSPAVVRALRSIKVQLSGNRIVKSTETFVIKAEPEQLPRDSDIDDPRAAPVGARKIWNKRVVEKKPDGHWHVVGTVAGLENPKKVPQLNTSVLDKETLLTLLRQLIHIHHAEHPPEDASTEANKQ